MPLFINKQLQVFAAQTCRPVDSLYFLHTGYLAILIISFSLTDLGLPGGGGRLFLFPSYFYQLLRRAEILVAGCDEVQPAQVRIHCGHMHSFDFGG